MPPFFLSKLPLPCFISKVPLPSLSKTSQTGKGTMYLLLTQFPLKSASTFPTKRPKKAKEPCIFDQWRSRLMVSFSCVCLCLHSSFWSHIQVPPFSLKSASTYPREANICGGKRPRRLHGCISLSLSLSLSLPTSLPLSPSSSFCSPSLYLSISLSLPISISLSISLSLWLLLSQLFLKSCFIFLSLPRFVSI